jgi:hypothetical protein
VADSAKDTIYIDIDDEITGIIDKIRASDGKIVALVLPKRASVFQSVVNMKLLKRASEQAKKHLVLITSETGLLPLAGAVGIYVARTLASKPEIPAAPLNDESIEEMDEETASLDDTEPEEITAANAGDKSVGELASLGTAALGADGVETIQLGDEDEELPAAAAAEIIASSTKDVKASKKSKKGKKDKQLKVPNFERFRILFIVGVLLIIGLIVGLYLATTVLPKASIAIQTDASSINTNVDLTLDATANALNTTNNTVPAKQVTEQKSYTATVAATGQQNNGQEASGTVQLSAGACSADTPSDIPAGTGVSTNGNTYITQGDTSFVATVSDKHCTWEGNTPTGITAQDAGAVYNTTSNATFTVASDSGVTGTGSANGGTDNIQTIVQQSDIANAEGKISTQNTSVKQDLEQQLQQDNLYAIPATFSTGSPTISASTTAGSPASNVTVTEGITYTMYGVPAADLNTLLNNNIKSQVNASQGILSNGLTNASFTTTGGSGSPTTLTMTSIAEVGPNINVATIKQQAVGKKSGDVVSTIKNDADVTNVSVKLSPFWVTTVPSKLSKITVTIAKPTTSSSNASN